MKGIIIYNHSHKESLYVRYSIKEFSLAAKKAGIKLSAISNKDVILFEEKNKITIKNKLFNNKIDFIIYWDKDKLGFLLEKAGYKLFNSAEAISNADSKILTQYKILNNNIPHPKTIISPLRYNNILDDIFYNKLIKELGLPMIIKEEFGSTGRQVYMAKNREELLKLENKLSNTSKLYQEYIKSNPSQSIRVYCIGGVIFGYVRFNNAKDFRSNTIGGGAEIFTPNKVLKNKIDKLCKKINKIFTLDYSGIDILLDKNNNPLFCEVNSNAGFQHFDKLYKESMASIYINYIIKRLKK